MTEVLALRGIPAVHHNQRGYYLLTTVQPGQLWQLSQRSIFTLRFDLPIL